MVVLLFVFCKQKTAYELRISDWSSDVCSSDLREADPVTQAADVGHALAAVQARAAGWGGDPARILLIGHSAGAHLVAFLAADAGFAKRQGAKPWLGTVSLDSAALDVVELMQRSEEHTSELQSLMRISY